MSFCVEDHFVEAVILFAVTILILLTNLSIFLTLPR
jgi:hypothetical protein